MSAAFDYPLTAKARLSRSSRLGTHTRSIQAHFRAAQSSPPRPLWFCIADMHSRSSKGPSRRPLAIGFEPHPVLGGVSSEHLAPKALGAFQATGANHLLGWGSAFHSFCRGEHPTWAEDIEWSVQLRWLHTPRGQYRPELQTSFLSPVPRRGGVVGLRFVTGFLPHSLSSLAVSSVPQVVSLSARAGHRWRACPAILPFSGAWSPL